MTNSIKNMKYQEIKEFEREKSNMTSRQSGGV